MKISIVTDAWRPQINGVVTTLLRTAECLAELGHKIEFITPLEFRTVPCPGYAEIRLSLFPARRVVRRLDELQPDAVHIATEGPLGLAARRYCLRNGVSFTTSYHTRFPEYIRARAPIPVALTYAWLRRFHAPAQRVMVATDSLYRELRARGFRNLAFWPRGVDTGLFKPYGKDFLDAPRPISLYMGRVAVEKNIEAFLKLDLPGTKVVVGGGPDLDMLRRRYPDACFTGYKTGEELARHLAAADVFVFPSRTDTFGLVLLEAMASGVPVAAYPVMGPVDVIEQGITGVCDNDLRAAVLAALRLDGMRCREKVLSRNWMAASRQFLANLSASYGDSDTPNIQLPSAPVS